MEECHEIFSAGSESPLDLQKTEELLSKKQKKIRDASQSLLPQESEEMIDLLVCKNTRLSEWEVLFQKHSGQSGTEPDNK